MKENLTQAIQLLLEVRDQLKEDQGSTPISQLWTQFSLLYFETDAQGKLVHLEGPCEALLGSRAANWLGRPLESLWNQPDAQSPWVHIQERWFRLERQPIDGGGERGLLWESSGDHQASQHLALELTQIQRGMDALQQELQSWKARSRGQDAFLVIFGREMRTVMHRLLGLASLVQQESLQPAQSEAIEGVRAGLEHLLQLAGPLQDSLGSGLAPELRAVSFDVRDTLAEVCRWMSGELAAKGVQLQIAVAASVPERLRGDVVKLRQILLQLLDNAVKFTTRGKVVVEAVGQEEVRFCIRDSGPGMSPDSLERWLHQDLLDSELESRGLGLRLAHYLVTLMGGRIWADSVPGKGTSIHFNLKFQPSVAPLPEAPGAVAVPPREGSLMILLAEDDPISQKVTLRTLRQLGHRVDIVSSGVQVLEALQRSTYDVVLLDVEMPEMDGLETARCIHQRFVPSPYLIALTAGATASDRRKAMLAGMHDYLAKPLRTEELQDALSQARL